MTTLNRLQAAISSSRLTPPGTFNTAIQPTDLRKLGGTNYNFSPPRTIHMNTSPITYGDSLTTGEITNKYTSVIPKTCRPTNPPRQFPDAASEHLSPTTFLDQPQLCRAPPPLPSSRIPPSSNYPKLRLIRSRDFRPASEVFQQLLFLNSFKVLKRQYENETGELSLLKKWPKKFTGEPSRLCKFSRIETNNQFGKWPPHHAKFQKPRLRYHTYSYEPHPQHTTDIFLGIENTRQNMSQTQSIRSIPQQTNKVFLSDINFDDKQARVLRQAQIPALSKNSSAFLTTSSVQNISSKCSSRIQLNYSRTTRSVTKKNSIGRVEMFSLTSDTKDQAISIPQVIRTHNLTTTMVSVVTRNSPSDQYGNEYDDDSLSEEKIKLSWEDCDSLQERFRAMMEIFFKSHISLR